MLTQITPGAGAASLADALAAGDRSDALTLLLGCHQRIRHFTSVAVRLSAAEAPPAQLAAAATAVHRYYTVALPLHEADENESVYPRLRAAALPQELAEANQAMVDQHAGINAMVAQLVPQWTAITAGGGEAPALARATAAATRQLQAEWAQHLELEESVIFPALRRHLSLAALAAIRQEMSARRPAAA
ncbi:MAG: hemerythrin domain-containing protein [Terriglobales bacterium]